MLLSVSVPANQLSIVRLPQTDTTLEWSAFGTPCVLDINWHVDSVAVFIAGNPISSVADGDNSNTVLLSDIGTVPGKEQGEPAVSIGLERRL